MSRYQRDRLLHPNEFFKATNVILDPCPFCGSKEVALYLGPMPHITCIACNADGPPQEQPKQQAQAGIAWNSRRK